MDNERLTKLIRQAYQMATLDTGPQIVHLDGGRRVYVTPLGYITGTAQDGVEVQMGNVDLNLSGTVDYLLSGKDW